MTAGARMEEIASVCVRQSLPLLLIVTSGFPPRWSGGHSTSAVSCTCDILHFFGNESQMIYFLYKWFISSTNDLFPICIWSIFMPPINKSKHRQIHHYHSHSIELPASTTAWTINHTELQKTFKDWIQIRFNNISNKNFHISNRNAVLIIEVSCCQ